MATMMKSRSTQLSTEVHLDQSICLEKINYMDNIFSDNLVVIAAMNKRNLPLLEYIFTRTENTNCCSSLATKKVKIIF